MAPGKRRDRAPSIIAKSHLDSSEVFGKSRELVRIQNRLQSLVYMLKGSGACGQGVATFVTQLQPPCARIGCVTLALNQI